jgi:integrase
MSAVAKIDLEYVQGFKDRHGKQRFYFRRRGYKRVALKGEPGSVEFAKSYAKAKGEGVRPDKVAKEGPRSIGALISEYYQSEAYLPLATSTKKDYRNILERFREKHGTKPVADVERGHINKILHGLAATPGAASNLRKRLRAIFDLAYELDWRDEHSPHPVVTPKKKRARSEKTKGFPAWSDDEIAKFEAFYASGTRERLAFALLLYSAQRRSDVAVIGRQHVKNGRISVAQIKGDERLWIPIHPALQVELDKAPKGGLAFVQNQYGVAFSAAGFTNWFVAQTRAAGIFDRTPHGVRKSAAARLAEAGCEAWEVAAITGHQTLKEVERYTKSVKQRKMADSAMVKLVNASGTKV